ncbi:MAG: hypothetical protein K8R86_10560, partial [Bacteroidales bacterium]|nr:hypothetical protein [Bacteroidales bacterium]
ETYLEIDLAIDQVEAINIVSEISANELAFNTVEPDETYLEIDLAIDQVEAINIVSEISANELAFNSNEPDETYLEIDLGIDQVEAINVVNQINANQLASNDISTDEDLYLEINSAIDKVNALNIVSQINTNELAFNITSPEETDLEIDMGIDQVEAINVADQIETNQIAFTDVSIDENIEVEIENHIESFKPLELVTQISLFDFANIEPDEYDLELNFSNDQVTPVEIINPIVISELAYKDINPNDINLEISFVVDQVRLIEIPAKVSPIIYANANNNTGVIEDIEIDFNIDNLNTSDESIQLADATNSNNVIAEETDIEKSVSNNFEVERSNFVYYLRESVMKPGTIETSKSDIDLLTMALNDPDELSYEELLYSATLAYSTDEKLAIYNAAFIHIDRDWRAFNNAAISAIHINNLNQADVYLYQASLISTDNGKIQNNMGILACYKKEFDKAEEHFIAATELGFNAYYNLQVVNSIVDATTEIADNIIINTDNDTHEVIGDIIDYGTSGE